MPMAFKEGLNSSPFTTRMWEASVRDGITTQNGNDLAEKEKSQNPEYFIEQNRYKGDIDNPEIAQ